MSGRSEKILYRISDAALLLALVAGAVLLVIFRTPSELGWREWLVWMAFLLFFLLKLPAALHELGHLLFGLMAGMRCAGITLSFLAIGGGKVRLASSAYAGETRMYPTSGKHIRASAIALTVGGTALGLLAGGVLLALSLALPYHPALLFCGLAALLFFYESLRALLPAELPAGKTDGAVLLGLLGHRPEEEVMLRVYTAQGILYRGSFGDLTEEQLDAPVVREDLPAFRALLFLQMQHALFLGEEEKAAERLSRLKELSEYCSEEETAQIERYAGYFNGEFLPQPSPFAGINALETLLKEDSVKKESRV